MGRTLVYPKRSSNTVKRYSHRATYDLNAIHAIINTSQVLHVSFTPGPSDPFPTTLPMIGQMASFQYPSAGLDEPLDCYIHGYISARMMNLARASDGEGIPLCIAATKVDGLILSLTPFSHSYNYRSAVLHGYGTLVTDEEEKLFAMKLITNSVVPDRWDNSRTPPDGGELASTALLRVRIVDGSGKIRDGGVSDEKKDYQNEETTNRIWTGIVPVWETFGEPVPSPENQVKELPEYIQNYTKEVNERNRNYAFDATKLELPKEEQH